MGRSFCTSCPSPASRSTKERYNAAFTWLTLYRHRLGTLFPRWWKCIHKCRFSFSGGTSLITYHLRISWQITAVTNISKQCWPNTDHHINLKTMTSVIYFNHPSTANVSWSKEGEWFCSQGRQPMTSPKRQGGKTRQIISAVLQTLSVLSLKEPSFQTFP